MAGITVARGDLDWKLSHAVVDIREAFNKIEVLKGFLDQYPSDAVGGDLLTKTPENDGYGYTSDEAYLIRLVVDQLHSLNIQPALELGRKLTGLE